MTVFCLFLNFDKNITDFTDKNCCKYNKTGEIFQTLHFFCAGIKSETCTVHLDGEEGRKNMEHITLFTDILPEEQERMRVCFKVREAVFQNGETIMEYSGSMKKIGLIQEGRAVLYCCDEDGNEYVIDELNKDSVFGELFLLPSDSQHYYVCAATETRVMFIDYEHVIKRCENACHHHSQMVSNLLQMTALHSRQQTDRIYMLSRSSTRKKLMAYLHSLAAEKNTGKFKLPMSYTALAQYLSVDRSAMMREIKNLSDEGVIKRDGRNVELR